MPVAGMQFTRMLVEKHNVVKGKVQVNNNVALTNVERADTLSSAKQGAAKFHFEFTAKYEPSIAEMTFTGFLTFVDEPKKVADVLESWKKDKKLPKDVMSGVLNTVLSRCNVEAVLLSREMNLPPPIPLPKVTVK
ncbi:MAG TPA: hypothetical protein VJJ82_03700 [Candidatus Nanoarchaeia archaeon]|nr:hypothetical protein [Candidatus Nanoarchaeia archaeon]